MDKREEMAAKLHETDLRGGDEWTAATPGTRAAYLRLADAALAHLGQQQGQRERPSHVRMGDTGACFNLPLSELGDYGKAENLEGYWLWFERLRDSRGGTRRYCAMYSDPAARDAALAALDAATGCAPAEGGAE